MTTLPRVRELDPDKFVTDHLAPRRPVIVTGEVREWPAVGLWTWDYLVDRFGDELVEVYDDWFVPGATVLFREFVAANIGQPGSWRQRYVRWFSQNRPGDGHWADAVFEALRTDWTAPALLPRTGYIVPPVIPPAVLDPVTDQMPYRAIFVSGAGARTRLHLDPWASSALLCGVVGDKQVTMWPPDEHAVLLAASERGLPGAESGVAPAFDDTLRAGELLFIPAGWWHEVETVTDAVSVTWNFVHQVHGDLLRDHLTRHPDDPELQVMTYFWPDGSPTPARGGLSRPGSVRSPGH